MLNVEDAHGQNKHTRAIMDDDIDIIYSKYKLDHFLVLNYITWTPWPTHSMIRTECVLYAYYSSWQSRATSCSTFQCDRYRDCSIYKTHVHTIVFRKEPDDWTGDLLFRSRLSFLDMLTIRLQVCVGLESSFVPFSYYRKWSSTFQTLWCLCVALSHASASGSWLLLWTLHLCKLLLCNPTARQLLGVIIFHTYHLFTQPPSAYVGQSRCNLCLLLQWRWNREAIQRVRMLRQMFSHNSQVVLRFQEVRALLEKKTRIQRQRRCWTLLRTKLYGKAIKD
mgnify:CR=1 FL=1